MLTIFEILGKIAIDNTNADKAVKDTAENASKAGVDISAAFEKIGSKAVAIGKTIAAGLAVGGAAITALTVNAMKKAGELEQNMGGSEAVFKECAEGMQKTAQTAYKNMGLSASEFMATANKMGALFQGVGFDIEESAELTTAAMQRASDVASIMGVDVSTAMESIAGAAKGNFTMLDNLGVAVNDTTIQNYALSKGIKTSTQNMTTQQKVALAMELFMEKTAYATGNYAKENDTLAGSLTTSKAALDNFLSGAGDAAELSEAILGSVGVILEKLDTLLPSLVTGIGALVQKLAPKIPGVVAKLLPHLVTGINGLLGAILPQIPDMFGDILTAVVDAAKGLVNGLIDTLTETFPALEGFFNAVSFLADGLFTLVDSIVDALFGAVEPAYQLSEAEQAIRDQAEAAMDAQTKLKESYADNAWAIEEETQRTKALWSELQTLADENGFVEEASRERAQFLINELSEATGIEIEMLDGTILKYKELSKSIDEAIEKKRAEALLSTYEEGYTQAIQAQANAIEDLKDKQHAYNEEKKALAEAEKEYNEILALTTAGYTDAQFAAMGYDKEALAALQKRYYDLEPIIEERRQYVAEAEELFLKAEQSVKNYNETIWEYETASAEIMAGNYEEASKLLTEDIAARWRRVEDLKALSEAELEQLRTDFDQAAAYAGWYRDQFEAGLEGFTEQGLQEAIDAVAELEGLWREAAGDAYEAGQNVADGLSGGFEANSKQFITKAQSAMRKAISAMKEVAQIASPSKVTQEFGKFLVEGLSEGISDSEYMAETAAADAMRRTTDGFSQNLTTANVSVSESSGEGNQELSRRIEVLISDLPDMIADAVASLSLRVNNREFARMVKAVE